MAAPPPPPLTLRSRLLFKKWGPAWEDGFQPPLVGGKALGSQCRYPGSMAEERVTGLVPTCKASASTWCWKRGTSAWRPRQPPGPGPASASNPRPRERLASSAGLSVGELAPRAPAAPASVDPSLQDLAGTRGRAAGGALLDSSRQIQQLPLTLRGHCKGTSVCQAVSDPPGQQLKLAARQYLSCRPLRTPHSSVGATALQEDFPGAKGERTSLTRAVHGSAVPRYSIRPPEPTARMLGRFQPTVITRRTDGHPHLPRSQGPAPWLPAGPDGWQRASAALPRVSPELSCSLRQFISARLCLGTAPVNARVGPCRLVTGPSLCFLPRWSWPWAVVAAAATQADSGSQDLR
uniref:Uncharacterized protein n=1 Tax=Rangifer tarandus platyrhynchus TaxID=3082113 RepID=A0ACB0DPT0_RANTA|nr:unnamed protein product [Rangifer tarandus platyrhynchus]